MTVFYRPLGFVSGPAATKAVEEGRALWLAGGPLAVALVERIERTGPNYVVRSVVPAVDLKDHIGALTDPRPPMLGLALEPPVVMGILNVTPDSFSDGGEFQSPDHAVAHAERMISAGARIIDIGGESTRPGAAAIDPEEEMRRVLPVIASVRATTATVISVDTRNAQTMRAALAAGASMINDVSALSHDADSLAVAASSGAAVVLMHMQGEPGTMQRAPAYDDPVLDIYEYLSARIDACLAAGISRSRIVVDPGIGFGKTIGHNLALLDQVALFHGLGVPLMLGVSRKRFIATLSRNEPVQDRLGGSLAAALAAIGQGVQIVRAHDVTETAQAIRVAAALRA